jgi:release factor glutamine methyltransferase
MQESLALIKKQLQHLYTDSEIKSFGYLILESVCRLDKSSVLRGKDKQLSPEERLRIREITEKLKKFRPIQYELGEAEFYGLKFKVDENVLIPRPETEELVELVIRDIGCGKGLLCLDIGTGSGCIAVALAKNLPGLSVHALDISEKALAIAEQNAGSNGVQVQFFRKNIFEDFSSVFPEKWDLIVSNPPYITPEEKESMSKNVLDYEPHQALFVPHGKPLLFYERIAEIGLKHLKANGALYLETSARYGKATAQMLENRGYRFVKSLKDISGKDRMIKALL